MQEHDHFRSIAAAPALLLALLLVLAAADASAQKPPLTLAEAVETALSSEDPEFERFTARAEALEERAVADAQLPDPKITGQVANVPTDSFEFDQDGMTQAVRVGLRQEFPAGKTLKVRAQQRRAEARAERARRETALREVELATRTAWLDLAYQARAIEILSASREAIGEQIDSLTARFATGRMHAQDVLRTELELSLLDDRLVEHQRLADIAREALARYIGREAFRPLPESIPEFSEPRGLAALENRLVEHPQVRVTDARVETAALGIKLTEQAYKPEFAIEGGYGLRTARPDLATIGITLSLPLFTDKRQDRRRAAAVRERGARDLDRDALLLNMKRQLEQELANWRRLNERIALYRQAVSNRARETAEATITTYANNQTDFAELIRSQLAELDVELKHAELETEAAKVWARLAWLTGDPS
ncbi:MAG: TolC family protein [Wenzhouxiangellaceae bacterium]|nr:TolC family protein [Wenzhouxiangellaceae bacterium]